MLRFVVVLLASLGPQLLWAQTAKPVSVSYENLIRCFPELKDESLSFKVDLNRLKELIDEKFVTSQSQLRQRKIHYIDADQQKMNLILRTHFSAVKKMSTQLSLQKVDEKGLVTDLKLTKNQASNPKQEVINNFLLGASIKSDEYSYIDTKLNGVISTYRRNFKEVMEIELSDKPRRRSVLCEKRDELGIICTCTKK